MIYSSHDPDAKAWVHYQSADETPKLRLPVDRLSQGLPIMIQDVHVLPPTDLRVHSTGVVAKGIVLEEGQAPCKPCDSGGFAWWQIAWMAFRVVDFVATKFWGEED